MNNLKMIRELYGATQEQVATAINVNRVTVANWEAGNSTASSSNREKLSLYYGIGPEYFYEKDLSESAQQLIKATSDAAKKAEENSESQESKEEIFHKGFESLTFKKAMALYMISMKMMLATADSGELDKLKTAAQINRKVGDRLDAIIRLREEENDSNEPSLYDLLGQVENEN